MVNERWRWPPLYAETLVYGFVPGLPQQAGSKRGQPISYKVKSGKNAGKRTALWVPNKNWVNGVQPKVIVTDVRGSELKAWSSVIKQIVESLVPQPHEPWDLPLALALTFWMPRTNKGEWGTGRNAGTLKDSARAYPSVKPDGDKFLRAFQDALTGSIWREDSRLVRWLVEEDYVQEGGQIGTEFCIYRMPATMGELREAEQQPELETFNLAGNAVERPVLG